MEEGSIFYAETYKIKDPKRLKQNAAFVLKIKNYTDLSHNKTAIDSLYAKYTTELNKAETAKNTALTAGNFVIKCLSIGYKTAEGIVKNEEGKRLKSGAIAAYNATPISYIEKGKEIFINKGDVFLLKFNYIEPDNRSLIDKFIYAINEKEN
ncbi:hypothetical protein IJ818_07265 [bacterium]|nr:hypothetical protein [bacterium]